MKLAPLLLAAPMVLTMAAADPRPRVERRVLDRWHFARQDESSTAGGAASNTAGGGNTPATTAAAPTTSTTPETTSTRETPTTTSTPVQTTPTSTREVTSAAPTSNTPVQSATTPTTNNAAASTTPPAVSNTTPTSTSFSISIPPPSTAVVSTTDSSGRVITSVYVITQSGVSVPATASSTSTPDEKKGVSQSTIIGLAVTGSIAGLLIILLIVWKLTSKRFSDLDENDDDAIKWPELNKDSAAMTPIPARPSTRAAGGPETDTLGGTDFDRQSAVNSAVDLSYQPYSDDPGYGARPQYYDPYGGAPGATKPYPSPPGSHDGDHKNWGGAADAQYYDAPRAMSPGPNAIARGMSPGPGMAYDARVASPAPPNMAYDNRVASPAPPNMAYADPVGRTGSPGPAGGYGYAGGYAQPDPYGGRHSPGPNMAYGQQETDPYGRRSPGPGMAYGGSVGRVASPGPNAAYR